MQIIKSSNGNHFTCHLDGKEVAKVHTIDDGLGALYVLLDRPTEYKLVYDEVAQQVGKRFNELPSETEE